VIMFMHTHRGEYDVFPAHFQHIMHKPKFHGEGGEENKNTTTNNHLKQWDTVM